MYCVFSDAKRISPLFSRLAIEVFLYPHADFSGTGHGNICDEVVFVYFSLFQ